ncbi:hypothetical protein K470DRAFT_258895 [Piedraia hortae CBS 480.64]|uniref:GIT Spa2 homology (SHD) domain-containing protein n=1 Tax=Piedraia hortae CBS 480.64 TaxID=1314780 RepID=A0A6A7BWG9_9PEZI|nr:hypothetical protein K470DRAFT_258895 [Piedraia hortae CBS 480.64]
MTTLGQFGPPPRTPASPTSFASGPASAAGTPAEPNFPAASNAMHPLPASPSGTTGSRPSVSGGSVDLTRPSSSMSNVTGFSGIGVRDSGRSLLRPEHEDRLLKHQAVFRDYLAVKLRDEQGNSRPNKARDKLLRLSATQFMELSTDVYDELIRREDMRTKRVPNVPPALPPKRDFHPKRNQARQRLASLPPPRFTQLAADVFYELERRIPRYNVADPDRPGSSGSALNTRPPLSPLGAPPLSPMHPLSPMGPIPGSGSRQPLRLGPGDPAHNLPPRSQTPIAARPLASKTIVPTKSTMMEDDGSGDEEVEDDFGLDKALAGLNSPGFFKIGSVDEDKLKAQQEELDELKAKVEQMERVAAERDGEIDSLKKTLAEREKQMETAREELQNSHLSLRQQNEALQLELDKLKEQKARENADALAQHELRLTDLRNELGDSHYAVVEDLQMQLVEAKGDMERQLQHHQAENEVLRQQILSLQSTKRDGPSQEHVSGLQEQLVRQEKLAEEVRSEARAYLQEMRALSRENDDAMEREERLMARVAHLESQVDHWRQRHAKIKAQNRNLRASTAGLGQVLRPNLEGLVTENGLVRDTDLTQFQTTIDDLLQSVRKTDPHEMLCSVKKTIVCVRSMTSAVTAASSRPPSRAQSQTDDTARHLARVTGTANSLITATKQHSMANGLSPVVLVDAAASNLTSAVIELVKAVGVYPSPFYDDSETSGYNGQSAFPGNGDGSRPGTHHSAAPPTPPPKTNGWLGNWDQKDADEAISKPLNNGAGHHGDE